MLLGYLHFTFHPPHRTALTAFVVLLCLVPPEWWLPKRLREAAHSLSNRRGFILGLVGILSFLATSSLSLKRGLPLPLVHDEFSYLLAADTFANGRLTNSSPPAWEHFETMHVLVTPTYQSKYPPGQGLMLALGRLLFGHPIWAVWIATALASMTVTWALLAVVPPRWGLVAGLITALHPQMLEWGQRYWGGSLATLGGALFLCGMLRIASPQIRRPTLHGIVAGTGLAILANTRPFEGAVLAIVAGVLLLIRSKHRIAAILGIAGVLLPVAIWMGYYNHRVTGHALRLPYQEHQRQYGYVPLFLFQDLPEKPTYRYPELEQFHVHDQRVEYNRRASFRQITRGIVSGVYGLGLCIFGNVGVLGVPILVLPLALWRDRRVRTLVIVLLLFVAALMAATFLYGHYAAPAAAVVAALLVLLMRRTYLAWGLVGRALVRVTVAVTILWSLFFWKNFFDWPQTGFPVERQRILDQLESEPDQHLVLVRYSPGHSVHEEWVYNEADLAAAEVVWARSMGVAKDRDLLEHFPGRRIWILEVGKDGARLTARDSQP